jgi:hypothetical protein
MPLPVAKRIPHNVGQITLVCNRDRDYKLQILIKQRRELQITDYVARLLSRLQYICRVGKNLGFLGFWENPRVFSFSFFLVLGFLK